MTGRYIFPGLTAALFLYCSLAPAQVAVLGNRYNNSRTAANLQETTLNVANVNVSQFGKLYSYAVDGALYAQPLYVPGVAVPGKGTHNVLYLATMNDKVYAYDADGPSSVPLWSRDFTSPPAVTAVPIQTITGSPGGNISGNVGIESTPVIDSSTGTLYLVARTLEGSNFFQRLHALDIATGAEKFGGPVVIQASVPGSAIDAVAGQVNFNPRMENQRSSLAMVNGVVLIAWAAHEDIRPWHGWVIGYNASTLGQTGVFCTTPDGMGGGIWEAGRAPVVDPFGDVYYETGNGDWDGVRNFGDSILRFQATTAGLAVSDWFTVSDQAFVNSQDLDVGSTGTLLIPNTNVLIAGSKESNFYLLNSQNLGHYNSTDSQIIQRLNINGGEMQAGAAFWTSASAGGLVYSWAESDHLKAFHFNGTTLDPVPVAQGATGSTTAPGGMLSVSASGNNDATGIVWASVKTFPDSPGDNQTTPGMLRAYRASNLTEIWNSEQYPARDRLGSFVKFVVPIVVNGKVYQVGHDNQLSVYGLLPGADFSLSATPAVSAAQGNTATVSVSVGALNGFAGQVSLQVSGYPAGVSPSFNPASVSGGGASTLTLNVAASVPASSYALTVTAASGGITHTAPVQLSVIAGGSAGPYGNGYAHRRIITVSHFNVPNTDQADFPLLVSVTDPLLKSAAQGGHVNSASGYDLVFSASPTGAGANLAHELEQYNAATGSLTAWVNVPLLSHSADTVLYMFYGNPSIGSSQENRPAVWDANFAGVWHLAGAGDSTGFNNSGAAGPGALPAAGLLGTAMSFDGTGNAFLDLGAAPSLDLSGPFTLSAWIKKSGYTGGYEVIGSKCSLTACNYELALDAARHDLEGVQNDIVGESGAVPSLNQWHHAVEVSDGARLTFYLDGAPAGSVALGTGAALAGTHFALGREQLNGENFSGLLDEARLSKTARSADWIAAEYRNQSNPAGFVSFGGEDAGTGGPPPPVGYPNGYAHRRTITVNHANVANSDQASFPLLVSFTDPLFKSAANGGHVNSASGYDIVFSADPNGSGANLYHEIDQYNAAAGQLTAWVNLPSLSHVTDTVIYAFYGNPSVNVSQENRPGVWDANYAGVWHLGGATDSTVNNNSGQSGAGVSNVAGLLGAGSSFNGAATAYLDMGTAATLDLPGTFTISAWMKKTAYTGNYEVLASKCSDVGCNYELALDGPKHDMEGVQNGTVIESGSVPSLNVWHYLAEVSDGVNLKFYVDGVPAAAVAGGTGPALPGTHFDLGREQLSGENFKGVLDEARVSKTARSADWVLTEYRNQINPAAFLTVGPEQ